MNTRVKLADVAKHAGVSTATVSRALSTPDLVRGDTLDKIREAIDTLGYLSNGAARALASRKNNTVGLVVPTLDHAIFSRFTQTLQATLAEVGYQLLITSHEYVPALELVGARTLLERGVDGLILVGLQRGSSLNELLAKSGVPALSTWSIDRSAAIPSVGFDNHAASKQVTRHLLDLGHRHFGVISGLMRHNDRARARVEGIKSALQEAGLTLPAANLIEENFTYSGGRAGMRSLATLSPRPTAIICGNDLLAIGALLECRELGLAVPTDVSITGFDNQELAAHIAPGLTTVNVAARELGRKSAQTILQLIAGAAPQMPIELPVELVIRGSTGCVDH